jgi:ubiquinone/menaquinone biosynthesis C-methylase UbiE
MNDYNPEKFWDNRFKKFGHTGHHDQLVYGYDQPIRLKAVLRALQRSGIKVNARLRVLDIGCGAGDFILEFAKRGANVTGIDISSEVINKARIRFANYSKVFLQVMKVEEMNFPSESFDLVISVTVLQHITDAKVFTKAVNNIQRVTKRGGHILLLEMSPERCLDTQLPPYIAIRSRAEWFLAFENEAYKLVGEFPLPEIGPRLLKRFDTLMGSLLNFINSFVKLPREFTHDVRADTQKQMVSKFRYFVRKVLLEFCKPLDYLFLWIPFPKGYVNLRLLIFKRLP